MEVLNSVIFIMISYSWFEVILGVFIGVEIKFKK